MEAWLSILCFGAATLAALTDLRTGLIPNWLTGPTALIAVGVRASYGGLDALFEGVLGATLVTIPNLLLFIRGALGGGDLKLFAALALALGPRAGVASELVSLCGVSLWVFCHCAWSGRLWALLRGSALATAHLLWPARIERPQTDPALATQVRMGPAIALAVFLVGVWGLP